MPIGNIQNPIHLTATWPANYPERLKAPTAAIFEEAFKKFPGSKNTFGRCKYIVSRMTSHFCNSVENGLLTADSIALLLTDLLSPILDSQMSVMAWERWNLTHRRRIQGEIEKSEEWTRLVDSVHDAEGMKCLRRSISKIQRKIQQQGGVDLRKLKAAGLDSEWAAKSLAIIALGVDDAKEKSRIMREQQQRMKQLSARLKIVAKEVTQVLDSPLSRVQWWSFTLGGGNQVGMDSPIMWNEIIGLPLIPSGMMWLSDALRKESKAFGKYLRHESRTDHRIALFLASCWIRMEAQRLTSQRRRQKKLLALSNCDIFARLLSDAHDAVGRPKQFSPDSIRQLFNRHSSKLIGLMIKAISRPNRLKFVNTPQKPVQ